MDDLGLQGIATSSSQQASTLAVTGQPDELEQFRPHKVSAASRFANATAQTFEAVSSWNLETEANPFVQPTTFQAVDTGFTMHAMEGNFDHLQQVLAFRRAQAKACRF